MARPTNRPTSIANIASSMLLKRETNDGRMTTVRIAATIISVATPTSGSLSASHHWERTSRPDHASAVSTQRSSQKPVTYRCIRVLDHDPAPRSIGLDEFGF